MTRPSLREALRVVSDEIVDVVADALEQRASRRTRGSAPPRQPPTTAKPTDVDVAFAQRELKRRGWPVPSKRST
jgi:hypothetical protein